LAKLLTARLVLFSLLKSLYPGRFAPAFVPGISRISGRVFARLVWNR